MTLKYKISLDAMMTILSVGGKITHAPNQISYMLNGIKYYSLEVRMKGDDDLIQAIEQEAIDLFNAAMTILDEKKTILRKIKKIGVINLLIFLPTTILFEV
jgi:hypothetical protein